MIIRNSEMTDFLRCRLKWDYAWNRNLTTKGYNTKLLFGTIFHKFLEKYYAIKRTEQLKKRVDGFKLAKNMMLDMFEEEISKIPEEHQKPEELGEMESMLSALSKEYNAYWSTKESNPTLNHNNWEVVATEQTYYIDMQTLEWTTERPKDDDNRIYYEATLDLIVRIDGKLYVVDHKTVASLEMYRDKTEMDRQISRYLFVVNIVCKGEEIGGFIYNLIKKELPKEPKRLKKGGLSKAKDQRTTAKRYLKALHVEYPEEIPMEDYDDILQLLKQRETEYGNDFMQRIIVKRNDAEINNAMTEFMCIAQEMSKIKDPFDTWGLVNPIYRNITKDCSWDCSFKEICVAGMDGSDVSYLEEELLTEREVD